MINGHITEIYKKQPFKVLTASSGSPWPPALPVQDILRDRPVWIKCVVYDMKQHMVLMEVKLYLSIKAMQKGLTFFLEGLICELFLTLVSQQTTTCHLKT